MNRKTLIILGCLFFQYASANAQALPPQIFGEWETVQKDDNIFDGNVHITTVKTSPGAPTNENLFLKSKINTSLGILLSLYKRLGLDYKREFIKMQKNTMIFLKHKTEESRER